MPQLKTIKKFLMAVCVFMFLVSFTNHAKAGPKDIDLEFIESLTHYAVGTMYDLYGMTFEATKEYIKAAEANQDSYVVRLKLGANYARLGYFEEATRELKLAALLNPSDLQSHYLLALIYSTQKKYDLAAQEYEAILTQFSETEPDNIDIYGYLGQLYYSQKKYYKAIEQFEKIRVMDPKNDEVIYLLGSLYLEVGEVQKGVTHFLQALEINPDHDGSLNSLGYVYAQEGVKLDAALKFVKKALSIDPNNGAYLDTLGWVYYKKKMYPEALKELKKAAKYMEDPIIYDHLGDVYFELDQVENASKFWELSLELNPAQDKVIKKLNKLKLPQAKSSSADQ